VTSTELLAQAAHIAGAGSARAGDPVADLIDHVRPDIVVAPTTPEGVAALLDWARTEGLSTIIRGSGSKFSWGRPPGRIEVALDMRRLNSVLTHASGDLIATVQAGASLREVNATLARAGQWLTLDPPHADRATIGGLVATNDSGPLRHRFGAPRDLILGVQVATTHGDLARSGGTVVKNVAGYDLPKLLCGSFGSLAAIVTATFRLAPLPNTSMTVVATTNDPSRLAKAVRDLMGSQLDPTAVELDVDLTHGTTGGTVIVQFTSPAPSVDDRVARARGMFSGTSWLLQELRGADEQQYWLGYRALAEMSAGLLARVRWRPAELDVVIAAITASGDGRGRLIGRAALGSGLLRIEGDAASQMTAIEELRTNSLLQQICVVDAPAEVRQRIDIWGMPADRARLLGAVKKAFDPEGILNASRGPL
jgi:glycolate oxidase FAD binding subunit